MLKAYSALGTVHRCDPCVEFPGKWLVYVNGFFGEKSEFDSFEAAFTYARGLLPDCKADDRVSISWCCTDGDPRIGKTWFTGYYSAGYFDRFDRWVS